MTRLHCGNHDGRDVPAVAVLVHIGQTVRVGAALCAACASCTSVVCPATGEVMDAAYNEPYCRGHADEFGDGDNAVVGPDIVAIDSDRYRDLVAEHGEPTP